MAPEQIERLFKWVVDNFVPLYKAMDCGEINKTITFFHGLLFGCEMMTGSKIECDKKLHIKIDGKTIFKPEIERVERRKI